MIYMIEFTRRDGVFRRHYISWWMLDSVERVLAKSKNLASWHISLTQLSELPPF
jgi:hypothetical protein